eukprot:CAMPEP_0184507628 /NCGR_PEP_ID=MMETSP0198_2-20121128/337_1 /TAXON_ID=1112570 /ORGANISM="Thraustochytrium sp., Strain LLF1b" /LENGTH=266 /DNA_ID=CAMNT_0026897375 /DNA_START=71 /DNA_END=868 /DNA_ORIENTATION=+
MAKTFCLITGASSGIGRALAIHLSRNNVGVFAIARRKEGLEETKSLGDSDNIFPVVADVTSKDGRQNIVQAVEQSGNKIHYLVQNAGIMGTVSKAINVDEESWRMAFEVNVHAPFFLTQAMVPLMAENSRILHIGSGAAYNAMDGWSPYCTTKAAFLMMYNCLKNELAPHKIFVGSVKPGIVESPMQETIRASKAEDMELLDMFKGFKENEYSGPAEDKPHKPPTGGLDTASNVAFFLDFLLNETSDKEFSESEWDIRDEDHHSRW